MRNARGAKPLDQEIGTRARARRRELGLSQEEVADALGISFQQVQKYERGANRISASTLVDLTKVLRCRPDTLLGTDGQASGIDWSRFRDSDAQDAAAAFGAIRTQRWRRAALELLRELARQDALHD